MSNTVEIGMRGQQSAEQYLQAKGCRILARNFRIKTGEIDLIIQDGTYIAFVEVKYRSGLQYGHPREAVTARKQKHIKQTAQYYMMRHGGAMKDYRFDVVEVLAHNGQEEITHLENAFY